MKKYIVKYVILLLIYIIITNVVQPYGLRLYYTLSENPVGNQPTVRTVESVLLLISYILNLAIAIYIIIDTKSKKLLDWLIILLTIFSPQAGITILIVWQIYKDLIKKYEAQHLASNKALLAYALH